MKIISDNIGINRSLVLLVTEGNRAENSIWENREPSDFPVNACYVSRRLKGGERSGAKSEGFWVQNKALKSISIFNIYF